MPRKKHKYHYIYKTTNLINQKYYIGMHSTNDMNDGYIGSGDRLRRSIKKYGKDNFKCEIIEVLPNRDLLKKRERELINEELLDDFLCMNITYGGGGGFISKEGCSKGGTNMLKKMWLDEDFRKNQIKRISNQAKKKWEEGIFIYKDNWTGRNHKKESKKKIGEKNSEHQKGKKNSQFGTRWITNGFENKKIKTENIIPDGWKLGRILK